MAAGIGRPLAVGGVGQAVRGGRNQPAWMQFRPARTWTIEGSGEIIRIQSRPSAGERTLTVDPDTHLVSDEIFKTLPMPYVVDMYGGTQEKKVALTFDDGPDPEWTPKVLDVLKETTPKRHSS